MGFMDLFVPMTAAFVVASVIIELLHFLMGLWLTKRHHARAKEYYKEVAEKMGMSPEDFMSKMEDQMNGMGGMGMMAGPPGMTGMPMGNVMTTASGSGHQEGQGQYL
jgi:hypothetical protein